MTTKELNRDVKRLITQYKNNENIDIETYRAEYMRLYNADKEFEYMQPKYALALMKINLSLRFIPLHQFGIHYKI